MFNVKQKWVMSRKKPLLPFYSTQALILKLKDPDPNPAVVISVLATIGELAQVSLLHKTSQLCKCLYMFTRQ